jgi:hypothetical protein
VNTLKLRPSSRGEVKYFDILIDNKPLAEYFAGRLGAIPDLIPPLGPAQPGTEQYRREQFERFLLEQDPDFPEGRNSILVCALCGDLGCGAFSARFQREGDTIRWSEFGYENNYDPDSVELEWYKCIPAFEFSWSEYESELRGHIIQS